MNSNSIILLKTNGMKNSIVRTLQTTVGWIKGERENEGKSGRRRNKEKKDVTQFCSKLLFTSAHGITVAHTCIYTHTALL